MLYSQQQNYHAPGHEQQPLPPPPTRRLRAPPENKKSILLSEEENKTLFELLGKGRQTLSTAIAQLLVPTPDQSRWTIRESAGVVCFVRDTTKRSYFIQVFSLKNRTMIFRQEIYSQFDYKFPQPWFIIFEGDSTVVGLNFADHVEASNFKEVLDNKLESKRHRRNDRRSRLLEENQNYGLKSSNSAGPILPQHNGGGRDLSNGGIGSSPYLPATTSLPNVPVVSKSFSSSKVSSSSKKSKKKSKEKDKEKGKISLRKEDIGKPMDFRHVQHVGWDPSSGFALDGVDDDFTDFFTKLGVSKSQLEDQPTREFIYNFIEEYTNKSTGISKDSISGPIPSQSSQNSIHNQQQTPNRPPPPQSTTTTSTPPPVPVRHSPQLAHGLNKPLAPPPPPVRSFIPPPPPSQMQSPSQNQQPPPRPAPITNLQQNGQAHGRGKTNGSVPPPPPPPPMGTAPAPPPPPPPPSTDATDSLSNKMNSLGSTSEGEEERSALLKQIQKGVSLKKVDLEATQKKTAAGAGGLSDCLNQIKTGVDLKKTLVSPKMPQSVEDLDGLAGALARALAARSKAINPDSSDSEDEEEDGFEDDEWE